MSTEYLLATGSDLRRDYLTYLAQLLDDTTVACLDATGIGPGGRCLDIGAGGGSITRWLAGRTGSVVAVDLDVTHLDAGAGVVVHRHDLDDGLPDDGPFDLIHARMTLVHLSRREEVLGWLVDALAPGGWLVVGECSDRPLTALAAPSPADLTLWARMQHLSHDVVGRARGISLGWAHEVDSRMAAAGLVDVKSVEYSRTTAGGEVGCLLHANLNRQAESELRQAGATGAELARYRELMHDPRFRAWFYQFVCTRGRKSVDHAR
jgi:SAM-dependent methyltransferase